MSLRRSPLLTPRALAARRSNAFKSTGPRTPQGKARARFNALRFGGRSARMASYLPFTGQTRDQLPSLLLRSPVGRRLRILEGLAVLRR